ncbi:MAG TPA: hypothetical protein VM282_04050 [Acidimicrobiales bacterium]|nr:hypothetical protein [Acidimicrobiales bacterium]
MGAVVDLRPLLPSEVARCAYCRRDIEPGEHHWYDATDGDLWCVDCDRPDWHDN